MGPVKRNTIAPNASRRLASELQAPLGQNAATLLKTLLRMRALLFLGSESGEQFCINMNAATLSIFIAFLLVSILSKNAKPEWQFVLCLGHSAGNLHPTASQRKINVATNVARWTKGPCRRSSKAPREVNCYGLIT
jgi:hypothetical protein